VFNLLWTLLETDFYAARAVFANGSAQQTRDLITALGAMRLNAGEQKQLKLLCNRLKGATTKRNRIVHGYWRPDLAFKNGEWDFRGWLRVSLPSDQTVEQALQDRARNQKVAANFSFTEKTIAQITSETLQLRAAVHELNEQFKHRLNIQSLPVIGPHSKPRGWSDPC